MQNLLRINAAILCIAVFTSFAIANDNDFHSHSHSAARSASELPAWKLTDSNRRTISSNQFAGRPYVLVLHLGEGCLHCAAQLHAFGDRADAFREIGMEVVAVSTDGVSQLAEQTEAFGGPFSIKHLASDVELDLFRQLGAFDSENNLPLHGTLLVDGSGRIRWSNISDHPFMEVEELLSEAKLVSVGATTIQEDENLSRPKLFLDKPPRVVEFQLKRLSNERLLLATRKSDDRKYAPVWRAILTRPEIDRQYRKQSVKALAKLNESDEATELIAAMADIKDSAKPNKQVSRELANMLLRLDPEKLKAAAEQLVTATESGNSILRSASYAALNSADAMEKATVLGNQDNRHTIDWLRSVSMVRNKIVRNELRDAVVEKFKTSNAASVKRAAVDAMKHFTTDRRKTFSLLSKSLSDNKLKDVAVKTMLAIPAEEREDSLSKEIVDVLLKQAENTKAKDRTQPAALDAMQLADELIMGMSPELAAPLRNRLAEVSVRVVRVQTVKEEMRYDVPYFAAQANRPIQIVLQNEDLMPHNLVICQPGKLKQVAIDGLAVGIQGGKEGKQYVPNSRDVLFATDIIQANETQRLTFKVPSKPGEYPFVCTFPQHWSRMYGVMVVVDDLQAWESNPVKPKDPIGNTRQFVKKWSAADFSNDDEFLSEDRSLDAGKRIFTEATCAQCHRLGSFGGVGANVGPALDDLYLRWKKDRAVVMKHIFDPSDFVDEKYKMYIVATDDGLTRSGLVVSQNDDFVELLESGSVSKTTKIPREEIEEMAESKKSVMPKALLDNFTKEEILDLMVYLESQQK